MKGARSVAAAAAIGSLLQGWDNAAVAGALLYLKIEFNLDENPTLEGLVVAATLIGAVLSTAMAGPAADSLGRRTMLIVAGTLAAISSCVMAWSPTIYILIFGRFLVGTSIGLAVTIVPIFISESAPTEIRGQLATLPQLIGTFGLFLAYCMVFGLSLLASPSWRLILGVLFIPATFYLVLCVLYLPESPRWLVSKGRMLEARQVLEGLRGGEDVSGELALLVEGLGVGVDTSLEEWRIRPAERSDVLDPTHIEDGQITLFGPGGPDEDLTWVAEPIRAVDVKEDAGVGHSLLSRRASVQSMSLMDNMVSLIGSLHPATDPIDLLDDSNYDYDNRSPFLGDEEDGLDAKEYSSDEHHEAGIVGDMDDSLNSPLLQKPSGMSRRNSSRFSISGSFRGLSRRSSSRAIDGLFGETVNSVGIGGGWQMAWRTDGENYERVFLLQEGADASRYASQMDLPGVGGGAGSQATFGSDGDAFQAVALVGPSVTFGKDGALQDAGGPATDHPFEIPKKGPAWSDLLDVGVKRALIVGVGLQFLQQFSGINAVLYFTPQILLQSGADVIAANVGLSSDSFSILATAVTSFLILPCILVAMWLMDRAGRRALLLATIPVVSLALVVVVLVNNFVPKGIFQAVGAFAGVTIYTCLFVMGFGTVPNILCSEIFPTRVRGVAIGITSGTFWICNVIVSYLFPLANAKFGVSGVFLFFAVVSAIAWLFVFLKVPETKGLPLEIICEFFAMTGNQNQPAKQEPSADNHDPIKKV